MKLFGCWLVQVVVPLAFAACLLLLFPALLENRLLIALSYCLGAFFLITVAFITWLYLAGAKHKPDDQGPDYNI